MFTGIITDIGRVRAVTPGADTRIEFATNYPAESMDVGASIACAGICLTVVDKGRDAAGANWFAATLSAETLSKTNAGTWSPGTPVNLERSLRVGDELGGHIVQGHVDGRAEVLSVEPEGASWRMRFRAPEALARYIAPKGSIALDGVSLTVNEVQGDVFGINVIPHTYAVTTFGALRPGDRVNLEIDVLARYVARLQAA